MPGFGWNYFSGGNHPACETAADGNQRKSLHHTVIDVRPDEPVASGNEQRLPGRYKLSPDAPVTIHDSDPHHAGFNFQKDLPSGSFNQLPRRSGDASKPAFTVVNRELNYELFGSEGFAFKLNLKPWYPNPDAPLPNAPGPRLRISIKF